MDSEATASSFISWLLEPANRGLELEAVIDALARFVESAGAPLIRVQLGFRTLHPEVDARTYRWQRGEPAQETLYEHGQVSDEEWRQTPIYALLEQRLAALRCPLERPDEVIPYPHCRELKAEGATDYVLFQLPGGRGLIGTASYATDRAGGFRDDEVGLLERLVPALSTRVELAAAYDTSDSLLRTYLGHNASQRVLAGSVRRGGGERIEAAIWMCDLRGFTSLVDRAPHAEVLETLDAFFACVAETVMEFGGEVLKFMGDAVLGIFPAAPGAAAHACALALSAAEEAFVRRDALEARRRKQGLSPVRFGIALHFGEVMFGNIGARGRLDFTVIGAAVNETARLEALCKELGTPLVLSAAFAEHAAVERAVSLGPRILRGVGRPVEVFTLPGYAPTPVASS